MEDTCIMIQQLSRHLSKEGAENSRQFITFCRWVNDSPVFGGSYCLHLQGEAVQEKLNPQLLSQQPDRRLNLVSLAYEAVVPIADGNVKQWISNTQP